MTRMPGRPAATPERSKPDKTDPTGLHSDPDNKARLCFAGYQQRDTLPQHFVEGENQ